MIPANMLTVVGFDMAHFFYQQKGLCLLHRFSPLDELISILIKLENIYGKDVYNYVGVSIGIKEEDKESLKRYINLGVKIVCIDVAHGDSKTCIDMTRYIAETYPDVLLISGNVATGGGAVRLWEAGADVVKCGIGAGCFAAGTKILMYDGSSKNIEDIVIGDVVVNRDGNPTKVLDAFPTGVKKVVKIKNNCYDGETYVTPDHLFWVYDCSEEDKSKKYKWKRIDETDNSTFLLPRNIDLLKLNNLNKTVMTEDYILVNRTEYEQTNLEMMVYDLTVDCDTHSFIANGMIVHNSACSTRVEAGAGVPQLSAVMEVAAARKDLLDGESKYQGRQLAFISDGGVQNPSDCVKALCFADMVMIGNLFAGTSLAPSDLIEINGKKFKQYAGSSTYRGNRTEGVSGLVKYNGTTESLVNRFVEGIQSGCSYQGCSNLKELKEDPTFVKQTAAGLRESHPHDIDIIK